MFSLVRFDNGEYFISESKRVQTFGNNCVLKYKSGAKYKCTLIKISDTHSRLVTLRDELTDTSDGPGARCSTPVNQKVLPTLQIRLSDISKDSSQNTSNDEKSSSRSVMTSAVESSAPSGATDILNFVGDSWENESALESGNLVIDESKLIENPIIDEHQLNTNAINHRAESISSEKESYVNNDYDTNVLNSSHNNEQNNSDEDLLSNNQSQLTSSVKQSNTTTNKKANVSNSSDDEQKNSDEDLSLNNQAQSTSSKEQPNTSTNEEPNVSDSSDDEREDSDDDLSHKKITSQKLRKQNIQTDKNESDSNSENDSDYVPDITANQSTATNLSSNSKNRDNSTSFDKGPSVDIRNVKIYHSKTKKKRTVKKYFCPYCYELRTKFARHLEKLHPDEEKVKKFLQYDKKTPSRIRIISQIRKKGIFLHNTNPEFNSGYLLTARLPSKKKHFKKSAKDFVCCDNCKDFYSKRTIRIHYLKCNSKHQKGAHNIIQKSKRKTGFIHPCASDQLRRKIFPVLRDNPATNAIAYDELIIKYGNKLCTRYTHPREYDMIRTDLRYLGNHKVEAKKLNKKINDYISLLRPENIDTVVEALKKVAKWNENLLKYDSPWVATKMSTLIKKVAKKYRSECIKNMNKKEKESIDNFLLLWEEEIPTVIHRQASEDQVRKRRQKKQVLPSKEDIRTLYDYLKKICIENTEKLKKEFDLLLWKQLVEATLIFVQIFNRRRPGDIDTLLIDDFRNQETINDSINHDIYEKLTDNSREIAKRFVRIQVRGKRNKTVPVLLHTFIIECINVILENRSLAGVKEDNKHVFSRITNNELQKQWISAYPLLRKFSDKCGAKFPSTLRSTKLRKHIATHTAMVGLQDADIDRLASFMGHQKDIHKNIYRVSVPVAEMTLVANLLESAMNKSSNNDVSDDESSDESGSSSSDDTENDENNNKSEPCASGSTANAMNIDLNKEDIDRNNRKSKLKSAVASQKRSHRTANDEGSEKLMSNSKKQSKKCASTVKSNKRQKMENQSSDEDDNDNCFIKKHKNKASKKNSPLTARKVIHSRWTEEEKESVHKAFGNLIKLQGLPSLDKCSEVIKKYKNLNQRTAEQLKSYIDNQRRKEQRRKDYQLEKESKF